MPVYQPDEIKRRRNLLIYPGNPLILLIKVQTTILIEMPVYQSNEIKRRRNLLIYPGNPLIL